MPPIIIGAAVYGIKAGAILGLCFGIVVLGSGIFGIAPTSAIMWSVSPIIMTVGTLGRGLAIGFTAGLLYKFLGEKNIYLAVIVASVVVPIVNTSIFAVVLFLFLEVLTTEGTGRTILQYATGFMIGMNFLMELVFNIVISSAVVRIIKIGKKRNA
jgi:uncharacterized membrane protein